MQADTTPHRQHRRPVFGCSGCLSEAKPPQKTTRKGATVLLPWRCPNCSMEHPWSRQMCSRIKVRGNRTEVVGCGYDRRTGEVTRKAKGATNG